MEIGHNGVIHTLVRGPKFSCQRTDWGYNKFFKISDRADLPLFSQIEAENVKILDRDKIGSRSGPSDRCFHVCLALTQRIPVNNYYRRPSTLDELRE